MLDLYDRVAREETKSEVSDRVTETESEVSENQEFSATPPSSLSRNKKLDWIFRRGKLPGAPKNQEFPVTPSTLLS